VKAQQNLGLTRLSGDGPGANPALTAGCVCEMASYALECWSLKGWQTRPALVQPCATPSGEAKKFLGAASYVPVWCAKD